MRLQSETLARSDPARRAQLPGLARNRPSARNHEEHSREGQTGWTQVEFNNKLRY
jgi:hypothetical protein